MSEQSPMGHIVWHDLLTTDIGKARHFYSELLGWDYAVEHATEFVWKSGEADYPLILKGGEAHGGFIEIEPDRSSRWLAFVAVDDVDAAVERSRLLGATMEKPPFDIPGVGRSAVVCDPQGAAICPYVASHDYPPPTGIFIWDDLLTADAGAASSFYKDLCLWSAQQTETDDMGLYTRFSASDSSLVAGILTMPKGVKIAAQWVPYIDVADVDAVAQKALSLNAQVVIPPKTNEAIGPFVLLRDPTGALFGLLQPAR
ncbi:VOC family protein [Parasphingorhabdus cellanae]|uniref:VOC family protein n=1 Tax=Parasphingorhabdus cellanae TaxID=2806553 RepID=A0ABX7T2I3_9SPHN|nr:VOC family protein [Parasphingorhabdus cellanae]QTD55012.1 VOC family protein [Parasphingorhabdus cellanae]